MDDRLLGDAVRVAYLASLTRLREALTLCPPELWNVRDGQEAPFWQEAMHVLFYAHLYLCESDQSAEAMGNAERAMRRLGAPMKDWSQGEVRRLGGTLASLPSAAFVPARVVSQDELVASVDSAIALCGPAAARIAAGGAFAANPMSWLNGTALDLLFYNLRHIEYHLGKLAAGLSRQAGLKIKWQ